MYNMNEKEIFILGCFVGIQIHELFLKEEEDIRKNYTNVLEWECETINNLYNEIKNKTICV